MFLNTIISFLACALMFISKPIYSYEVLILGRFLLGLACGKNNFIFSLIILSLNFIKVMGHLLHQLISMKYLQVIYVVH